MSDVLVFPTSRIGDRGGDSTDCAHETFAWGEIHLSVCPEDGTSEWSDGGEPIDGAEAMARLFGQFDLVATIDAIGAPGPTTLVYDPGRRGSRRMRVFPPHRWFEGSPGLYFAHDGTHLLLSPVDPRFIGNLTR